VRPTVPCGFDRGVRAALRLRHSKPMFSPGRGTDGALRPGRLLQPSLRGKAGTPLPLNLGSRRRTRSVGGAVKAAREMRSVHVLKFDEDVSHLARLSALIRPGSREPRRQKAVEEKEASVIALHRISDPGEHIRHGPRRRGLDGDRRLVGGDRDHQPPRMQHHCLRALIRRELAQPPVEDRFRGRHQLENDRLSTGQCGRFSASPR